MHVYVLPYAVCSLCSLSFRLFDVSFVIFHGFLARFFNLEFVVGKVPANSSLFFGRKMMRLYLLVCFPVILLSRI